MWTSPVGGTPPAPEVITVQHHTLTRIALRLGFIAISAAAGFALSAAADGPAKAADAAPGGLVAHTVDDLLSTHSKPGPDLAPPRIVEHPAMVTQPATKSINRTLDDAPEPVAQATGSARHAATDTTTALTGLLRQTLPLPTDTVDAALTPAKPLLETGITAPTILVPQARPPLCLSITPANPATVASSAAPRLASAPAVVHTDPPDSPGVALDAQPAIGPTAPDPAGPAMPGNTTGPATYAKTPSHASSSPESFYDPPRLLRAQATGDEPARPAGRSPKPTPGPA